MEASLYPRLLLLISVPSVTRATLVLGSSVREKPVEKRKVAKTLTTQSILIPGLEGSNQASSSVLYSSSLTSTTKRKISALSPNSLIFKPNPQKATISKISSSLSPSSIKVFKSTAPRSKNKKSNHVGYEGSLKLQRKLKSILLQASLKTGKTEKQIKKKNPVDPQKRNSISRKLAISEISCSKLSNKHIYSSPTILASFPSSKTNQLSSHPPSSVLTTSSRSSNFSSHSSSFQSNYSQIIAHLKAEWELAEDSEIFDIKNTGKASQEEFDNVESEVSMEIEGPAAPPSQTPIHTTSPPVQAEIGPPDISPSTATDSPLVGEDPLSHEGDIILEGDSFLDEIEILRMSSPPPSKLNRGDGSLSRVQCRVRGCRDYLASVRAWDRHENKYCRFREGAGSGLSSDTFPVSSHAELHIDTLPCRVCLKAFGNEKARKRHEKETHQIYEMKGRTFSPVRFSSPVLPELPLRPQSCPPKVKEHPGFVTPERPEKRRRTVSSSTTTLGSPLSSPCLNLSPQFSPSLDFSPLGSPQLALSPRSGSSASSGMSSCEPPSNECSFCGTVFLNLKNQKRHQCFFSS